MDCCALSWSCISSSKPMAGRKRETFRLIRETSLALQMEYPKVHSVAAWDFVSIRQMPARTIVPLAAKGGTGPAVSIWFRVACQLSILTPPGACPCHLILKRGTYGGPQRTEGNSSQDETGGKTLLGKQPQSSRRAQDSANARQDPSAE